MVKTSIKLDNYVVLDIENPNTKADSLSEIGFGGIQGGRSPRWFVRPKANK